MAQSIKLGNDTYLDASGVVMSDHTKLDAHTSYIIKFPDGTMIQYGVTTIAANADSKQVSYPSAFVSSSVFVVCTPTYASTPNVTLTVASVGASSFMVYRTTAANFNQPVYWIAIGAWK